MSVQLLGKRELKRLGSVANDGAGADYSGFAKGMMAKMGWAEGQGLGKDKQGRSTYVQVKKKEDNAGLGKEKAQQHNVNDQWYFNAFDSALANIGGKKKKGVKKKKREKAGSETNEEPGMNMYVKMFKAAGGARMGMRARASQNGKLARTEGGEDGVGGALPAAGRGEGQRSAGRKRKRWAYTEDIPGQPATASAEVTVKQEKPSGGAGREEAKKEESGDAPEEEPKASTKAERKRERSEAKRVARKAKRAAGKEKEDEEARTPNETENGEEASEKDKKARKKKKRERKGAV